MTQSATCEQLIKSTAKDKRNFMVNFECRVHKYRASQNWKGIHWSPL